MMSVFTINDILKFLPHRYPFLLVDKVVELTENGIVGIKNVTMNEPQFTGHFPDNPILPGVLQLEAMAQVGGIYCGDKLTKKGIEVKNKVIFFTTIDNVKFKKPVIPGDVMRMEITITRFIERSSTTIVQMHGETKVDGELASSADLGAWLVDRDKAQAK
ncbi:MAG: 3-hydroxyacyl-ACP dehydratase FabZ [Spirochaetes bacterium]|nr:3-hydroxyacyl-ACP dehydratase FabZ [Spirochaetota bacterium]